jgi:D-aminopeptidase
VTTGARRARDFGLVCGCLPTGPRNSIVDVPGLRVGHVTLVEGETRTGVTAVLPHGEDLFRWKAPAACCVINGFGKSVGLMQVEELGAVETPILLTNTFAVPACARALIDLAIEANPAIGRATSTVNPVVLECNDGALSDIQAMAVTPAHARAAIAAASETEEAEGDAGAGAGMSCFGFKGGVGTASRRLRLDGAPVHLGALTLANFGRAGDLVLPDGRRPRPPRPPKDGEEKGSIIVVLATDAPLDNRQLRRIARRAGAGIARLGAFWGNGSGDIALAVSTDARIAHDETRDVLETRMLNEARIDRLFQAAAETTQEAVLNALCAARPTHGRGGTYRPSLADWLAAPPGG